MSDLTLQVINCATGPTGPSILIVPGVTGPQGPVGPGYTGPQGATGSMGPTGPSGSGFLPVYGEMFEPSNVGSNSTYVPLQFVNAGLSSGITLDTSTNYSATVSASGIYRIDLNGYTYNAAGTGTYAYGFNIYQNSTLIAQTESSTASGVDAQGSFSITWLATASSGDVFMVQVGSAVANSHAEFEAYFTLVRVA